MSEFGRAFDACQRAHDNATPDSDWPDGPECDCGKEMTFSVYINKPRYLFWKAECKCGNKRSYDSAED